MNGEEVGLIFYIDQRQTKEGRNFKDNLGHVFKVELSILFEFLNNLGDGMCHLAFSRWNMH